MGYAAGSEENFFIGFVLAFEALERAPAVLA